MLVLWPIVEDNAREARGFRAVHNLDPDADGNEQVRTAT